MADRCLSCDWDFNENPDDRNKDAAIGQLFCKWCGVAITRDEARDRLAKQFSDLSDEQAAEKAEQELSRLDIAFKR